MVQLYGISNCGTVKKARAWLADHGVEHSFSDFKKAGVDDKLLQRWQQALGWETLLNRRGSTWRALPEARRAAVTDAPTAAALMVELPSLIKRPVLVAGGRIVAGFTESEYEKLFPPD